MQEIIDGFDFTYISELLLGVIPSLICITLHEMSHGYAAYRLGDSTAKDRGRLSLNPIKHIDPAGLLMMLIFHFGWAKPVPINMYNFKNPKRGMAISAIAGPLSNILIAVLFLMLFGLLYVPLCVTKVGMYILRMMNITAGMSLGLAVFNLLPFPPLDGSKVLFSVISDEAYLKLMRYERYGGLILLILAWTGVISEPLSTAIGWVRQLFYPIAQWGLDLFYFFFG